MADRKQNPVNLSFASSCVDGTVDYWMASATGDWRTDNALGRKCAEELINEMRAKNAPMLLGHVVGKMIEKGNHEGVEVGFCAYLAAQLINN